jgi:acyl-CoA thioesterase
VAVALAEQATDRPPVWTTVQFIRADTTAGDRIDCATEVLAFGHRTAQVRVTGRLDGSEVFCALGATAIPKLDGLSGTFEERPRVLPPEQSRPFTYQMPPGFEELGIKLDTTGGDGRIELRIPATEPGYEFPDGHVQLWIRLPGRPATPAVLGFLGDLAPIAVIKAAGRLGGGNSIDNTLRFSALRTEGDWVLADIDPQFGAAGFANGTVHLWSQEGELLGTASQTSQVRLWD